MGILSKCGVISGLVLISVGMTACTFPGVSQEEETNASVIDTSILGLSHRNEKNRSRDTSRNPIKTLAFFEVKESDYVVEIWPGGGWYTEVLAPVTQLKGRLTAAHFSPDSHVTFFRNSLARYQQKLASDAVYSHIKVTHFEPPAEIIVAESGSADKVLTFRNVHNWMRNKQEQQAFNSFFDALKPGGILGVVEHRAPESMSREDMVTSGYVSEGYVKELAKQAGFEFVASSEINANPLDTKDHPKGVWTLPPSLRMGDVDREKYLAIGESDRMTLKFRRPLD